MECRLDGQSWGNKPYSYCDWRQATRRIQRRALRTHCMLLAGGDAVRNDVLRIQGLLRNGLLARVIGDAVIRRRDSGAAIPQLVVAQRRDVFGWGISEEAAVLSAEL